MSIIFPSFFRARERSIYYDCAIFINKPHLWLFPYEHFSLSCLEQNPALDLGRELDSHSVHQLYYSSPPTERQYKQKGSLVSVILFALSLFYEDIEKASSFSPKQRNVWLESKYLHQLL